VKSLRVKGFAICTAIFGLAIVGLASCGGTGQSVGVPCHDDGNCALEEYCGFRDRCGYEVGVCVVTQPAGHCCTNGDQCASGTCNFQTGTCL
jgi:hypothetical protein